MVRSRSFHLALAAMLLLGGGFHQVQAADADHDGVSDVEEIQEYGTDPFSADIAGMVADAEVHIASLPSEFTLIGRRLLITGYGPRQAGSIELQLQLKGEVVSVLRLTPDERGIFSGLWDLGDVCETQGKGTYEVVVQGEQHHRVTLSCDSLLAIPLGDVHFAGKSFPNNRTLVLESSDEAVFEAVGQPWLRLYTVYASIVFSKDLYSSESGKLRVAPWKPLQPGNHTLYVVAHDPIRRLLYEPIVIPFTVVDTLGDDLKATIYYAPGGLLIILSVFTGSILYIRRMRALRRGIASDGEWYPDEYY